MSCGCALPRSPQGFQAGIRETEVQVNHCSFGFSFCEHICGTQVFLEKKADLPSDSTQDLTECKHAHLLKEAAKATAMWINSQIRIKLQHKRVTWKSIKALEL
jgi:hypothetical protein